MGDLAGTWHCPRRLCLLCQRGEHSLDRGDTFKVVDAGAARRIRCKAAYAVNATGKAFQQTLRCASNSYRVEISSNVISEGGSLSGSWAEATRGVAGNISGRASGAEIGR